MNTSTLNRSVLAVVIGTALAAGAVAPAHAQAWRHRQPAQEQAATTQSSDSREDRRKEREAAARKEREDAEAARVQQQRTEAQRQREQAPPRWEQPPREDMQPQRGQAQRDRELAELRQQQERIREQNRETHDRNAQAQSGERFDREQAQAQREQSREDRRGDMADARERQQQQRGDRQDDRQQDREAQRDQREQNRDQREQNRDQRQQDRADTRHADLPAPRRIETRQRDQRIVRNKEQARSFQQAVQTRIAPQAKSYAETLNHQHRSHGYHYQQQYYWRLLQMLAAWNWSSYNYYNDPYFYTADDYRYYRGGSWYSINRYGADILRQAVNYGYQEGFYAGRADQQDGWRFDYRGAWVYRDANYGYRGFYVNQGEYNYYFREGFRRGYEDGYYQRYRYGRSYNGSDVILGTVLSGILNLQAYRW
jgi:hypothetical protein